MTRIAREAAAPARRRLLGLLAVLGLASLPVLLDASAIRQAATLDVLARHATTYWWPSEAPLLYLRVPVVVLSAIVFLLAPGLLLSVAMGQARSPGRWVLSGFAVSLAGICTVTAFAQIATHTPVTGGRFAVLVIACALVAAAIALFRAGRADGERLVPALRDWAPDAGALLLPAYVVVALLLPKFLWDSFNGDGAHAFETMRLLLSRAFPFWPSAAGPISSFPGITSMLFAYPGSWFIRLFGSVEASARIPFVMFLVLLVAALGEVLPRKASGTRTPYALIWCTLAGFVLAMAFSATYNPYSADLALPATQDTLLLVCFFAYLDAFRRGETGWLVWWSVLTYVSLPNGALLLLFWIVAATVVMRPVPRAQIYRTVWTLLGAVVVGALLSYLLPALGLPAPGTEYGAVGILRRFAFLQITDWRRLLWIGAPCGILPLLATLAWRRQDALSRAVTLVTWGYFGFFFIQGNVSLHHFIPAMVLPLIVFWRLLPQDRQRIARLATVAAAGAGFLLSMPTDWTPHLQGRLAGSTIAERIGGYGRSSATELHASTLLASLFPYDWDPAVPAEAYGGSPLVWNHYARHDADPGDSLNFLLQPASGIAPAGWHLVATDSSAALYVRDSTIWAELRAYRAPAPVGAPLLRVSRWVLFRSVPPAGGPAILDVVRALEAAGVNLDPLLRRLGVAR